MTIPPLADAIRTAGGDPARAENLARAALASLPPGGGDGRSFIAVVESLAAAQAGPLAGCVFAVKDNIDLAGSRTTCGSRLFAGDAPAEADAGVVALLRAAGALCIGKNNMHELALGATGINPDFGTTTNLWDRRRGVGGSSGGSAVAVAEGQVHLSLGTDSGGSVRIPASMTGIVGFKPSPGILPLEGVRGALMTIDCVGLFTADMAAQITVWDGLGLHASAAPRRPKLAFLHDESMGRVQPKVWASYRAAIDRLRDAGADLTGISIAGFERAPHVCVSVAYPEAASDHFVLARAHPELYDPAILALFHLGELWSAAHYVDAQRARTMLEARFAEIAAPYDAVLMPTCPVQPPVIGEPAQVAGDPPGAELYTLMRFTVPFNVIGWPAISVPAGLDADRLPVGLQLVGRPGRDRALLEIAANAEEALGRLPNPLEAAPATA